MPIIIVLLVIIILILLGILPALLGFAVLATAGIVPLLIDTWPIWAGLAGLAIVIGLIHRWRDRRRVRRLKTTGGYDRRELGYDE